MINSFTAFDFETANDKKSSICQVGFVRFENGIIMEKWSSLVNPEDDFHSKNIAIHGIRPENVINCPTFPDIFPIIKEKLTTNISISHTNFDPLALEDSIRRYNLSLFPYQWLDNCEVARNVWPQFRSHSLNSLFKKLNLPNYQAHDALDDAIICGHIFISAIKENKAHVEKLTKSLNLRDTNKLKPKRVNKIKGHSDFFSKIMRKQVSVKANPSGHLSGKHIVFTGNLSISRKEAAQLAADVGCTIKSGITKSTNYLVVGEQDLTLTKGKKRSSKQRKADDYIAKGIPIKVLSEKQFLELIDSIE